MKDKNWEKEWLLFKNKCFGKHPRLWSYNKVVTIEETGHFIRHLLKVQKRELKKKVEGIHPEIVVGTNNSPFREDLLSKSRVINLLKERKQ